MFQEKVVVVSGVGPGLGRAVAVQAAQAGADVVLAARRETVLTDVAVEVEEAGGRALVVPTDITDPEASQALVDRTLDEFGRVDALINNAFAVPPIVPLQDVELADMRQELETDIFGALRLTQLFLAGLTESRGAVVMISSIAARQSKPGFGAYKITKSGLIAMAQTLATELGPSGVRVNTVVPGSIWAEPLQDYYELIAQERGVPVQTVYDENAAALDLRELPEASATADAVLFLASTKARAITGQCLDVNGGEHHH